MRRLRATILLLLGAAARAEDVVVDLVPGWRKDDVCDLALSRTIRVRGAQKVGRAERAITVERSEEAEYRDKVLTTTRGGAAGNVERKYRRARTTTVTTLAGLKSETKKETDPAEGSTRTLDQTSPRAFLVDGLDQAICRKGVKVGETWAVEGEEAPGVEDGKLTFKLVEVLPFKGQRAARVFVSMKAKVIAGAGKADVTARGYVYFSLDCGRIVRSNLSGPVKLEMENVGTVHGTIAEEATLSMVEVGGAPGAGATDAGPSGKG